MSVNLIKLQGITGKQVTESFLSQSTYSFGFPSPFLILLLIVWCVQTQAQPNITNLQLSKSASEFTLLSGTGFGQFDGEVLSWDDFDTNRATTFLDNTPAIKGYSWLSTGEVQALVDNQFSASGSQSVKFDGSTGTSGYFGWRTHNPINRLYISYWRRTDSEAHNRSLEILAKTKSVQVALVSNQEGCWQVAGNLNRLQHSNSSTECHKQTSGKFQRWDLLIDPQNVALSLWLDDLLVSAPAIRTATGDLSEIKFGFTTIPPATGSSWFDDVYIATTQARVEACNAPEYGQCTHKHLQYVAAENWGTNEIKLRLHNLRALRGESIYLYVVDSNGQVSNGIAIARPVIKAN